MPKSFQNNRAGAKALERYLNANKGGTVYTIADVATNLARYEDSQLVSTHTFAKRSPVTGHWLTGHMSAAQLLATRGTVYTSPPRGIRNVAKPGRQVGAPLGDDYHGRLDEAELRGLEKQVRDGSNPRNRSFWGL